MTKKVQKDIAEAKAGDIVSRNEKTVLPLDNNDLVEVETVLTYQRLISSINASRIHIVEEIIGLNHV